MYTTCATNYVFLESKYCHCFGFRITGSPFKKLYDTISRKASMHSCVYASQGGVVVVLTSSGWEWVSLKISDDLERFQCSCVWVLSTGQEGDLGCTVVPLIKDPPRKGHCMYVRPLYREHCSRSPKTTVPHCYHTLHWEPPGRGQPLYNGQI